MKNLNKIHFPQILLGLKASSKEERLQTFRQLYQEYHLYVRKTLYYLVPENQLDDLVQDVFLKVWARISQFRFQSSYKTWIYRVTVNTAYDFYRKNPRLEIEPAPISQDYLEKDLILKEIIHKGILSLPVKLRSTFVLFYQQDLSLEETAKVLRLPRGTVKSRLHHARSLFVAMLKKNGVSYENLE